MSGVNNHCPHCQLDNHDITQTEFQCFPGSPNQVMFRGKVQDRAQATAREVIYYMEQWISSSDAVTIPVHHARLDINSTCVVLIASLDDPECPGYLTAPSVHTITTGTNLYGITQLEKKLTTVNQPETVSESAIPSLITMSQPQSHTDTGAIVGGAVAIVFIIMSSFILIFLLYMLFKHSQTKT